MSILLAHSTNALQVSHFFLKLGIMFNKAVSPDYVTLQSKWRAIRSEGMNYEYDKWGNNLQKEDWSLPRKMVVFVWVALEKQNITLLSTSVFKKSFVFCFKSFFKK